MHFQQIFKVPNSIGVPINIGAGESRIAVPLIARSHGDNVGAFNSATLGYAVDHHVRGYQMFVDRLAVRMQEADHRSEGHRISGLQTRHHVVEVVDIGVARHEFELLGIFGFVQNRI